MNRCFLCALMPLGVSLSALLLSFDYFSHFFRCGAQSADGQMDLARRRRGSLLSFTCILGKGFMNQWYFLCFLHFLIYVFSFFFLSICSFCFLIT